MRTGWPIAESDRVRAVLDQHGIEYSRIIYTYDEYRNILYGNSTSLSSAGTR